MTNYEVASPCISLCKIDEPTHQCLGCYRNIDEITRWSTMSNAAKQLVVDDLARRIQNRKSAESDTNRPPIGQSDFGARD